jgi:hypothetical protein
MAKLSLIYFSSDTIQGYCKQHPIDWAVQELANGPGNILTPSPAIEVFFNTLVDGRRLFNQEEYWGAACQTWSGWVDDLKEDQRLGLKARLYRNFYPSAIDSIHVWALLVESGEFAYCLVDTIQDAVSKTDITVYTKDNLKLGIALSIATPESHKWQRHKRAYRHKEVSGVIVPVELTLDRPKRPGNKRWYRTDDFGAIWAKLHELREQTVTPVYEFEAPDSSQLQFMF